MNRNYRSRIIPSTPINQVQPQGFAFSVGVERNPNSLASA